MPQKRPFPRICIALGLPDSAKLLEHARQEANDGESFLEFRLDYLDIPESGVKVIRDFLKQHAECIVLATCRRHQNHGKFNGSVEDFNGWFQEPLLQRRFHRPGDLRRELVRLQEAVNTQHVHPRLGGRTPAQHRRGLRLRRLPASFVVPTGRQKLAAGRVIFIRRVSAAGTVTVLSQSFRVGRSIRACTCDWSWTPGVGI